MQRGATMTMHETATCSIVPTSTVSPLSVHRLTSRRNDTASLAALPWLREKDPQRRRSVLLVPATDPLQLRGQGAKHMTGTIKTTVNRGFGFITGPTGTDYFFHRADLADGTDFADLREGDEVNFGEFSPRPEKGPRAINVQRVEMPVLQTADSSGSAPEAA